MKFVILTLLFAAVVTVHVNAGGVVSPIVAGAVNTADVVAKEALGYLPPVQQNQGALTVVGNLLKDLGLTLGGRGSILNRLQV